MPLWARLYCRVCLVSCCLVSDGGGSAAPEQPVVCVCVCVCVGNQCGLVCPWWQLATWWRLQGCRAAGLQPCLCETVLYSSTVCISTMFQHFFLCASLLYSSTASRWKGHETSTFLCVHLCVHFYYAQALFCMHFYYAPAFFCVHFYYAPALFSVCISIMFQHFLLAHSIVFLLCSSTFLRAFLLCSSTFC